jgi:hypothetical protein
MRHATSPRLPRLENVEAIHVGNQRVSKAAIVILRVFLATVPDQMSNSIVVTEGKLCRWIWTTDADIAVVEHNETAIRDSGGRLLQTIRFHRN